MADATIGVRESRSLHTGKTVWRSLFKFVFLEIPRVMPPSSVEDRIRLLTDRAIVAKTQDELDAILPELKAAIKDHIRFVRAVAVETIPEAFGTRSNATD